MKTAFRINKVKLSFVRTILLLAAAMGTCTSTTSANEAHHRLSNMSPLQRNDALTNFMAASGERCKVERSFYQGKTKSQDVFWNVACSGGKSYSIMIKNNKQGSTQILNCDVMRAVAKVECFKKFSN